MTYSTIDEWISDENGTLPSRADQIRTAYWFYRNDITQLADRDRRTAEVEDSIGDRLKHDTGTVLGNLAEIDVLTKIEPASRRYILVDRTGQMIFTTDDDAFPAVLYEEISRLVYDIHLQEGRGEAGDFPGPLHVPSIAPVPDGGVSSSDSDAGRSTALRTFVASELEVEPHEVEATLVEADDPVDCMTQFDEVVEAIKESDEVERGIDYDQMGWRNGANRWSLSERATHMEDHETLGS